MNYRLSKVIIFFVTILGFLTISNAEVKASTDVSIDYKAHVQYQGWQNWVNNGQAAGTTGKALRVEAMQIKLQNPLPGMKLTYQTHVQYLGWMNPVQSGQTAGTTGKALRMEAIKINLEGVPGYHVEYQAHVQYLGWMKWVKDGQIAGTVGKGLRMEAIRVKIVKDNTSSNITTYYQPHVENIGWQNWKNSLDIGGTTGKGLRIEAIKINVQNLKPGMNIKYQAHVQYQGWQNWVHNGQTAGTTGKGLRMEALKIVLEGMPDYEVQYQAHVQYQGWQNWVKDGQIAGTTGKGLRIEAIRIRIVKKQNQSLSPINEVTSPKVNETLLDNQNLNVTGWALNKYGVQEINVYSEGTLLGKAKMGLNSADANARHPGYANGSNSGFSFTTALKNFSQGSNTIKIEVIGKDQTISEKSIKFNVSKLQPKIWIDTPSDGTFVKDGVSKINVSGWSIDRFGVKKVEVYLDNAYKGSARIGISRPDVKNAYPAYTGSQNSGFAFDVNVSGLSNGYHKLTVKSIGKDGETVSQTYKLFKFNGLQGSSTVYNITLSQMVDKQMQQGSPVKDVNWKWVAASRSDVEHYVNPQNFMDSNGIYQFLRLDFHEGTSVADLNNLLAGKGVLNNKGQVFLDAARNSNINPIYLVAHALLETGNGRSKLATGIEVKGKKVYNVFGIHAFDRDPNAYGSEYAYEKGWFSVDEAIRGGALWISGRYINNSSYKQNTLYKMRWNPSKPAEHQYATDIRWAYNQVYNIKRLIDKCNNPNLVFDVPVYK